jgi:cytochrome c oxidase subunit 4
MAHAHDQHNAAGGAGDHAHGAPHPEEAVHAAGAAETLHHHGHTIVPASTLMAILMALLFFTLLTVGASKFELLISHTFNWHIPALFNVGVALSIAVIKTTLVVLFFMQLKYDSPVNGMIFIYCLITVSFFLGFTMLDLGNRGTIDRFKAVAIVEGGTGIDSPAAQAIGATNQPITKIAHDAAIANGTYDPAQAHHVGHGAHQEVERSSPQRSRPLTGLTPDVQEEAAPPKPGAPVPAGGH